MTIKVKTQRWTKQCSCDIGIYKTTVTIYGDFNHVETLNGNLTRKQAIEVVYRHLLSENRVPSEVLQAIVCA